LRDVVVISGARTPFGEFCGELQQIKAIDLGAVAARGAIERAGIRSDQVDQVIFGNVMQTSRDALFGARHVGLKSGVPFEAPALTVNRMGGSGLQAILSGSQLIRLDEAEICLVGGMENMSQSPQVVRNARSKAVAGLSFMEDSLWTALLDTYNNMRMVETAEILARRYNISREEQDEFALRSYMAAVAARDQGRLSKEIIPVVIKDKLGEEAYCEIDESIRETTIEKLAAMKPAGHKNGSVTSGNSSGINDGAAALIIASKEKAENLGLNYMAALKSYSVAGVDPDIMGIGLAPALQSAVEKAGLDLSDIGLFEIHESFAAQYLACERDLKLDRNKVNVNGGAIAIGNPLAASGARLVLTLLLEMSIRDVAFGAAALSIGGGQGIAVIFEKG